MMKIEIGFGMGKVIFGMLQEDVKGLLGEPDKISDTEKHNGIVYYYNNHMTKYKFDEEEEDKLYSIEVFHPEVIMFDQSIINKSEKEIIDLLKSKGYEQIVFEDYETFNTVFCEEIWTTFEFEFDKLRGIEFSPLFKDENERIWPYKSQK